jgi:hypothetical protein
MRDRQPIRTARRKLKRNERERQGLATAPCVLCIQQHHTAGKNHDPRLKAPLCEMHHRELHEQMLRAGVSLRYEGDPIRRAAMAMRAMSVYRRAEADAMDRWADLLDKSRSNQSDRRTS